MSEMALIADHLIVIGRGRLIADVPVAEFIQGAGRNVVRVRSPQATELRDLLAGPDVTVTALDDGALEVSGLTAEQIGEVAGEHSLRIHELTPQQASLEEAFMELTRSDVEYQAELQEAAL